MNLSEANLVNFRTRNIAEHCEKRRRNETPQIFGLGHKSAKLAEIFTIVEKSTSNKKQKISMYKNGRREEVLSSELLMKRIHTLLLLATTQNTSVRRLGVLGELHVPLIIDPVTVCVNPPVTHVATNHRVDVVLVRTVNFQTHRAERAFSEQLRATVTMHL